MWWTHGDWGWGAWLSMTLFMLAFLAVVAWVVVTVVRGSRTEPSSSRDPERILAERLATGEIDEDEYQRRLDTLRGTRARQPSP